jgi:hypothetical protein
LSVPSKNGESLFAIGSGGSAPTRSGGEWCGSKVIHPLPRFFVSVDSKRVRSLISPLKSTLARFLEVLLLKDLGVYIIMKTTLQFCQSLLTARFAESSCRNEKAAGNGRRIGSAFEPGSIVSQEL